MTKNNPVTVVAASAVESELDQKLKYAEFLQIGARGTQDSLQSTQDERGNLDSLNDFLDSFIAKAALKTSWRARPKHKDKFASVLLNKASQKKIKRSGNIGLLRFFPATKGVWGDDLVGGSLSLKKAFQQRQPSVFRRNKKTGRCDRSGRAQVALDTTLAIRMRATLRSRENDSEYLLLNAFDQFIQKKAYREGRIKIKRSEKIRGRIELFTERVPCPSCFEVIKKFLVLYPGISIKVFYVFGGASTPAATWATLLRVAGRSENKDNRLHQVKFP